MKAHRTQHHVSPSPPSSAGALPLSPIRVLRLPNRAASPAAPAPPHAALALCDEEDARLGRAAGRVELGAGREEGECECVGGGVQVLKRDVDEQRVHAQVHEAILWRGGTGSVTIAK